MRAFLLFTASLALAACHRDTLVIGSSSDAFVPTTPHDMAMQTGGGPGDMVDVSRPPDLSPGPLNATTTTYPSGSAPSAIVAGDWNRDGLADLAVTNSIDGNVSIFLNAGQGALEPARLFPTGVTPMQVAAGLVDADAVLDLVTLNQGDGTVTVLLGKGDGGFGAPIAIKLANAASGLALADFNRDAHLDIAVGDTVAGTIVVLPGAGDGSFGAPKISSLTTRPYSLAVTDYDSDGAPDLIVGMQAPGKQQPLPVALSVLHGRGDATFTRTSVLAGQTGNNFVRLGALDGDNQVAGMLGNSTAILAMFHVDSSGIAQDLAGCGCGLTVAGAVGDLHGPGSAQLALLNQGQMPEVDLYFDGQFLQHAGGVPVGQLPVDLVTVDLDGNGAKDLAVANNGSNDITVALNPQ